MSLVAGADAIVVDSGLLVGSGVGSLTTDVLGVEIVFVSESVGIDTLDESNDVASDSLPFGRSDVTFESVKFSEASVWVLVSLLSGIAATPISARSSTTSTTGEGDWRSAALSFSSRLALLCSSHVSHFHCSR